MTALEKMKTKRIFSFLRGVTPAGANKWYIVEQCDGEFEYEVDKAFVLKLAEELIQFAEKEMR